MLPLNGSTSPRVVSVVDNISFRETTMVGSLGVGTGDMRAATQDYAGGHGVRRCPEVS